MARLTADPAVPRAALGVFSRLVARIGALDDEIASLDRKLDAAARQHEAACRLMRVPGIGPIGAMSLVLTIDAGAFESGRHLAAWLGLVPREHSTGGRQRLGRISRAGNERLRQLLVIGATAAIRHARAGRSSAWLLGLLERKPRKLAAVALANKMARIVWAMLARGTAYRALPVG